MSLIRKVNFIFRSGKNPKWKYYLSSYLRTYSPAWPCRALLRRKLDECMGRTDYEYMCRRANYYNQLKHGAMLSPLCPAIEDMEMSRQKVYFLDTYRYARYFRPDLRLHLLSGDIIHVPEYPMVTKSRPIGVDNTNSVLLKLDRVRHFIFLNDRIPFERKSDIALFRGRIAGKDVRQRFLTQYFGHPMIDAGDVGRRNPAHPEWLRPKLTLHQHLKHKFILTLEGNDVASNLKWVMSSNSIAVMPRPTCETWFMEGTLQPGVHYIEIADDLSDLPDKLDYYLSHPKQCLQIIANANEYVAKFRDKHREDLISLMVLEKYFKATGQM